MNSSPMTGMRLLPPAILRHFPDEYNAVNLEQRRQEILNDITDTTGAAFLGITLGCCRCHDHKTDPIEQRDYYRIQAFFAGMWPIDAPLISPEKRSEIEKVRAAWEVKTAEVRAAIEKIEKPYRDKERMRQRRRFPVEYARLLDVPASERSPLEKQLGAMIEKQVYARADVSKSIKGREKEEYDRLKARLAELSKDKPAETPVALAMSDLATPPPTHLLKRGNWRNPAKDELAPGFLSIVNSRDTEVKPVGDKPGRRARARQLDCFEGQPAHGAGDRQPALAASLRQGDRRDLGRFRRQRRAADASGTARLAGWRTDFTWLVPQVHAPPDRDLSRIPTVGERRGWGEDRPRQPAPLALPATPARRRSASGCHARGGGTTELESRRAVGLPRDSARAQGSRAPGR